VKLEWSAIVMSAIYMRVVYGGWWWEPFYFPVRRVVHCPRCWNAFCFDGLKAGEDSVALV
jgi:hypothetical protein